MSTALFDRINKAKALDDKESEKAKKIKDLEFNHLKLKLEEMLPEIKELMGIANELVDAGYFRLGGGCPLYSKYVGDDYGRLNFHTKLCGDDQRIIRIGFWHPGRYEDMYVNFEGKIEGYDSIDNLKRFVDEFSIFKENFMSDLNEFLESKGA